MSIRNNILLETNEITNNIINNYLKRYIAYKKQTKFIPPGSLSLPYYI